MKTFEYTGYDAAGKTLQGLIEALDLKQAREKMAAAGIFAEMVRPAEFSPAAKSFAGRRSFSASQRAFFYRELAALLRAGLPLAGALEFSLRSPDLPAAATIIAGIRDKIREGSSLADALAAGPAGAHPAEIAFITAGEQSGELDQALKNLAFFLEEEAKLRERIITALIYPAIIVAVALAIAIGLLGFTVPRLARVMADEMQMVLPLITRIMLGLGKACLQFGPLLLAALVALALIGWRLIARRPEYGAELERKLFGLPLIGPLLATMTALRFARTLALLLRGGVPLVESLRLAGRATGSGSIRSQSAQAAEAIRNGASLSAAVGRIFPLGPMLAGLIQIGENSGTLEEVLQGAAERLQNKWEQQVARIMAWIEPALILAVGLFVLLVVVSILLPILTLHRRIM